MKADMDLALHAARMFGMKAEENQQPRWSKGDRLDIASHYGVDAWRDIPIEHQNMLLASYRLGERQVRARVLLESIFVKVIKDWTPADWEETSPEKIRLKIEEFMDEGHFKRSAEETVWAFEKWMGW